VNEHKWKRDPDQFLSAKTILKETQEEDIFLIDIPDEPGMIAIAFGFKESLDNLANQIVCIALDGTREFGTCLESQDKFADC
jgi:hypothetical protein